MNGEAGFSLKTRAVLPETCSACSAEEYKARFTCCDYETVCDFIERIAATFPKAAAKHDSKVSARLSCLEEIRFEPNDSKYHASSKDTFIVFFKDIRGEDRRRLLHHELFHFIQQEGSIFECCPPELKLLVEDGSIKPLLFEEAFVQYMASLVNGFPDEKRYAGPDGEEHVYWLNGCYRRIAGYVKKLHEVLGTEKLLDMFMDDESYIAARKQFDEGTGPGSFNELFSRICDARYPAS